jgi:hypothetical protein
MFAWLRRRKNVPLVVLGELNEQKIRPAPAFVGAIGTGKPADIKKTALLQARVSPDFGRLQTYWTYLREGLAKRRALLKDYEAEAGKLRRDIAILEATLPK